MNLLILFLIASGNWIGTYHGFRKPSNEWIIHASSEFWGVMDSADQCELVDNKLAKINGSQHSYELVLLQDPPPTFHEWVTFFKKKNRGDAVKDEISLKEAEINSLPEGDLKNIESEELNVMQKKLALMQHLQTVSDPHPSSFSSAMKYIIDLEISEKNLQVQALKLKINETGTQEEKDSLIQSRDNELSQVKLLTDVFSKFNEVSKEKKSYKENYLTICEDQVELMTLHRDNLDRKRVMLKCPVKVDHTPHDDGDDPKPNENDGDDEL